MSTIEQVAQAAVADALLELYDLDLSSLDGPTLRFTPNVTEGRANVRWRGETYTPIPIQSEGWETPGQGALPTPILRLSNTLPLVSALIIQYGDLVGCQVTRWRTFRRFLDDGEDSDQNAYLPLDIYRIERKRLLTKNVVEWELSASLDQAGKMLPGRQAVRDYCPWRYRIYEDGAFDYDGATCPYTGTTYANEYGQVVTNPAQDKCGKRLTDCVLRFGSAALPFGGFPAIAKTRTSGGSKA
jgi:lambda family phage minor tail protein L